MTGAVILLGGIVVLLLLWLAGTFHPKIETTRTSGPVDEPGSRQRRSVPENATLVAVRPIRVPRTESAVGTIRAVHETAVASRLLAKVNEVYATAGQSVTQGAVLVRLDDEDLKARRLQAEAAVDSARAKRDQARTELERIQRLFKSGAAAQIELDRISTTFKSAEAELRNATERSSEAETILSYATVQSPIDGMIIDKKVEVGDTVTPGQVLVTLYDPTRMQLVARVRESLMRHLTIGQPVDVRVEALGKTCQGWVNEIVPEAETASRTFSVKVTGPCPPGVYTGMFGRLLIPLDEEEVLVLPRAAIRRVGQLDIVDVAEGGVLRRRVILPGRTLKGGDLLEVLAGLRPGEEVIVPRTIDGTDGTTP
jgi:RND family efflux transporter MFP subunit